jgi:hypothetical protein
VSRNALLLVLALQASFDAYSYVTRRTLKPNSCYAGPAMPLADI